jgi:hypothetical protein
MLGLRDSFNFFPVIKSGPPIYPFKAVIAWTGASAAPITTAALPMVEA